MENCKDNPKLYYKIINEKILGKTQDDSYPDNFIKTIDGTTIEDNMDIANYFNSYFVNIGPEFEKHIHSSQMDVLIWVPEITTQFTCIQQT